MLTDPIDAKLIGAAAGKLKVISQMAVGVDNIDIAEATRLGIPVGHTPEILTDATADHTWALMMAAARRIVEADNEVRQGIWRPWGPDVFCGTDFSGATLGIIGFGRIGQAVASRASGFKMCVQFYDHSPVELSNDLTAAKPVSFEDLLKTSDFISLHVYLSPQTFHMIGMDQFKLMKPTSILINTSRGSIVDPAALRWALENKLIMAAGIDVYEPEPITHDDPLLKFQNIVITPHIASATVHTREKMAMVAVDNLIAGLNDEKLPFCANPEVYLLKSK